jgi:hypothetical protein
MSSNPADEVAANKKREREKNPVYIERVDRKVVAGKLHCLPNEGSKTIAIVLPKNLEILLIAEYGNSAWCETFRVDTKLPDGTPKQYFLKVYTVQGYHNGIN